MALYSEDSVQYLHESDDEIFDTYYHPGGVSPASGIYRCIHCGHEMTSIKGKRLTTQDHDLYGCDETVVWELIVATEVASILGKDE